MGNLFRIALGIRMGVLVKTYPSSQASFIAPDYHIMLRVVMFNQFSKMPDRGDRRKETKGATFYKVVDFCGWRGKSLSIGSFVSSTAATGSDSLSLVGRLCSCLRGVPVAAPSGFLSERSAPVTGLEPYWTLRSPVSEILLSSVTNDSPHQALQQVSIRLTRSHTSAYLVYFRTYLDSF
jgi:hypothetical protein